jgi:hypothetical protein
VKPGQFEESTSGSKCAGSNGCYHLFAKGKGSGSNKVGIWSISSGVGLRQSQYQKSGNKILDFVSGVPPEDNKYYLMNQTSGRAHIERNQANGGIEAWSPNFNSRGNMIHTSLPLKISEKTHCFYFAET